MRSKETANTFAELQHSLRQQELVSEIALGLNALEDFGVRINRVLDLIGAHTGVSRVYIFENSADGTTCSNTFEWCNSRIEPQIGKLQDFPYAVIPSWCPMLEKEGRIYSENIGELPDDLRAALEPQDIRSIVVYPLYVEGRFFGFIGFDECIRNVRWSRQELELLRTLSGIVANAYERKLMEAMLRCERDRAKAANRAKSEFLANMSHEIRSPMHTLLGFSEALAGELPDPAQRKMVESIIISGNFLLSMLNDILDLSKIEAGRMEITPGEVAPGKMFEDIRVLFGMQAGKRGIGFFVTGCEALPEVLVFDEVRVKQVIFNLLGNAMKFTRQGEVRLKVTYSGPVSPTAGAMSSSVADAMSSSVADAMSSPIRGEMSVEVSDTGIGIPKQELTHIFEPFVQGRRVSGCGYGGAGLGLSICKRLVEQMHGTMEVESRVGKGSVFSVKIPCSEP